MADGSTIDAALAAVANAARAFVAKAGDGRAVLVDGPRVRDEFATLRAAVADLDCGEPESG